MSAVTVTYLGLEHLSKRGDYDEYIFSFSLVDTALIGAPEESSETSVTDVAARISRSLQSIWRITLPQVEKVLFEHSRRALLERLSSEGKTAELAVDLNSSTAPRENPYDLDRIAMATGTTYEVDVHRPLGFRGT